MAKYDGLIIPRSYNDYINKSDPLGVSQALQLTGVMDDTPTAGSSKPVKSSGLVGLSAVDVVETGNMHPVTSNAVAQAIGNSKDWVLLALTTQNDEHITVSELSVYKEFLLTLHRRDGRVCGSSVTPVNVFIGGGVYAIGIDSLATTITEFGVAVWESNTQIEIAGTYYQARFFGR